MRLALLGDIHGNFAALQAVLVAAKASRADILCITGDFVGYYYEPARVLDLISQWPHFAVRGNHEDMLFAAINDLEKADAYRRRYGSGLDAALSELSMEALSTLKELPQSRRLEFDGKQLLLGHGAPWSTNFYIYPDAAIDIWSKLSNYNVNYIVLGHTHHSFARRVCTTLVINPGSVGQPRDRKPGAAWALLDTERDVVDFHLESYDPGPLISQVCRRDPLHPYLAEVLVRR
jgi:putative phosphoesterase